MYTTCHWIGPWNLTRAKLSLVSIGFVHFYLNTSKGQWERLKHFGLQHRAFVQRILLKYRVKRFPFSTITGSSQSRELYWCTDTLLVSSEPWSTEIAGILQECVKGRTSQMPAGEEFLPNPWKPPSHPQFLILLNIEHYLQAATQDLFNSLYF